QVKQTDVDLVVMTTHARAGVGRTVFGSVADDLLHRVEVPLLMLHGRPSVRLPEQFAFHHIVIALDGSPMFERIIGPALGLASLSDAKVTIVTAITRSDRYPAA